MNAFDRAYVEDPDTVDADEVADWWARLDLERDSRLFFDADGRLAGVATRLRRARQETLDLDALRPPRARRPRARQRADRLAGGGDARARPSIARTSALAADAAAGRAARTARGFEPIRHFYRMAIDLDAPPPAPEWPEGFAVATFRPGEEAILHAVIEEAFADHWGHEYRDLRGLAAAHVRARLVGPVARLPRPRGRRGRRRLAVQRGPLRRRLGRHARHAASPGAAAASAARCCSTAFGEFYRRGERRVALAVDAGNETGATHLYESVGMRVVWQADMYEKRLQ